MRTLTRRRSAAAQRAGGLLAAALLIFVSCSEHPRQGGLDAPSGTLYQPLLRRLTPFEYENTLHDLLGADLSVPRDLEPIDRETFRFTTVGAAKASLSEQGIERLTDAATRLAGVVFADGPRRAALVGCEPADAADPCIATFLRSFGRRAWRRPLSEDEVARYGKIAAANATRFGDVWTGLGYAVAGLIASPHFLFRAEIGPPQGATAAPGGPVPYTGYEMAGRLSFLLWGTTPDEALLGAAERGALGTREGVLAQADRLLAQPRSHTALLQFFEEHLGLDALDQLVKDPVWFPRFSKTIGASMRREIELVLEDLLFARDGDVRDLLTTRKTFVNGELAALYGLAPPKGGDFVPATFSAREGRAGLLGFAGLLASAAHADGTSPTLRGKLIREQLLGEAMSPPPVGVSLSLLEAATGKHETMRSLLARHGEDPSCSGCHGLTDPLGLGLEHFDGLGGYRENDLGLPIDASSELDGKRFASCAQLGALLHDDPRFVRFLVTQFYRYALGRMEGPADAAFIAALGKDFAAQGYRFSSLVRGLVGSDAFRYAVR